MKSRMIGLAAALVLAGGVATGQVPPIDTAAVQAACGPIEQAARAGRARMLDVVVCANREATRQLDARTPFRVDEVTTMDSVEADGPTVIYRQRVAVEARNVTDAMRASLEQTVRANVCGNSQMRNTISLGGAYTYVYVDRAGAFLHRIDIRRC